jgi:hypothetical protein
MTQWPATDATGDGVVMLAGVQPRQTTGLMI